ncbi:MAG: tetratricopeptide repeat protein [Limisphaerales bacterium]
MQPGEWKTLSGRVLLLLLATAVNGLGAASETGKARLLGLVQLPAANAGLEVGFDTIMGFNFSSNGHLDVTQAQAEIAALKRQVTGAIADAGRYLRRGDLHSEIEDTNNANLAYAKAADLYRKRVELQPEAGPLLTEFGDALTRADKDIEAESMLRKAVRVAPREWKCWVGLGNFLDGQGNKALPQGAGPRHTGRKSKVDLTLSLAAGASGNELAEATRRYTEAQSCFDHAAALAPSEPEVYLARSMHLYNQSVQMAFHKSAAEPDDVARQALSTKALPDLWQVARLSPTNYVVITAAALFEAASASGSSGSSGLLDMAKGFQQTADSTEASERLLEHLPKQSSQLIRQAMAWLENLTHNADPDLAAGAFTGRGILKLSVLFDGSFLDDFRRAIALNPSLDCVWDMVTATMGEQAKFDQLIPLCQQRLKDRDNAHNRFFLAKVLFASGQYRKAEQELRAAVKLEPDNFSCVLGLAAVLMKQDSDAGLVEAQTWILKARQLSDPSKGPSPTDEDRGRSIEYLLTGAIFSGLIGHRDDARNCLNLVRTWDKDNQRAQEILAALGGR